MTERYDVLVVGAGPAGLAAAKAAASHGARVGVLDAQPRAGGQVWRHDVRHAPARAARKAMSALDGVDWLVGHQVVATGQQRLLVEANGKPVSLDYGSLVLATGARELLLPFPGWTLPGVTGAGGLQSLVKQGWPIAGKRVVVAGSGPLLLAAAASLRRHGAQVLGIYEQASSQSIHAFARQLLRWPGRAIQAAKLRAQLAGVPYHFGSWASVARGGDRLRTIELHGPHGTQTIACDHLAVGYGLVPNTELASLLGCALGGHGKHPQVRVDELMHTSVDQVYAAGEACGIGGLATARIEGRIAGLAATGIDAEARTLMTRRGHERRFAALLQQHFSLNPQLYQLATPETLICRCEDVPLSALDDFADAREAKLATRCGMGACQGRICGTALNELGRFPRESPRSPIFPARLATLASADSSHSDLDRGL